jgi:hypothetical protein
LFRTAEPDTSRLRLNERHRWLFRAASNTVAATRKSED